MSLDKSTHVIWECKYHIVIVSKYRYKIFDMQVKEAVKNELKKLCLWMKVQIIEGHVCRDHIHMCISLPPKMSVSNVIGTLKGKSASRLFKKFPELRKKYWGSHFWSRRYYVSTVGKNEEMIRQYIRDQDKLDKLENQGKLF